MFGSLVQKLQTLSPIGSPITSPVNSPKTRRKFGGPKWRRNQNREEYREVQSDPEMDENNHPHNGIMRNNNKIKEKSLRKRSNTERVTIGPPILMSSHHDITMLHIRQSTNGSGSNNNGFQYNAAAAAAAGPSLLHGSKSLGRLDGMKEV
jgi:hypothetical protein